MTTTLKNASRSDGFTATPDAFTVVDNHDHPLYDPRIELPLDLQLVQSIFEFDVLQPIRVIRDGDRLLVQDGRQRVRAALEANKLRKEQKLPAVQVPFKLIRSREDAWGLEGVAANMHVRTPPMMLAEQALRLEKAGRSREQIAVAMGCTATMVENYLRIYDCDVKVQRAVAAGQVPATVARKMAEMPREKQREALDEMIAKGATKGTAGARAVAAAKRGEEVPERGQVHRMQPRAKVAALKDALEAAATLKPDTHRLVLPILRWVLGEDDADIYLPEDVREALGLDSNGKKKRGAKGKAERESAEA